MKEKKVYVYSLAVQIVLMMLCAAELIKTDSLYVCYELVFFAGFFSFLVNVKNKKIPFTQKSDSVHNGIINIFAILYSLMVTLSNYPIWTDKVTEMYGAKYKIIYGALICMIVLTGSFICFYNILFAVADNIKILALKRCDEEKKTIKTFTICFASLALSRLFILFTALYPGVFSCDTFAQVIQINSGEITNHHPYVHTMIIKGCIDLGMKLFGNNNSGIAIYCVIQILFISLCFSYCVSTIEKMQVNKYIVILSFLFFLLMPYHIMFAFIVWKDGIFCSFVLVLIVSLYRYLHLIGKTYLNMALIFIAGVGTCLFRSNGFFAFVLFAMAAVILLWDKKNIKLFVVLTAVIIISFGGKHIILDLLEVPQPDLIESLSIPTQQISRVVYDECELNDWQKTEIEKVIDTDFILEKYSPKTADPMKEIIRLQGNQQEIADNRIDYIKLYLSLGINHPFEYTKAWIDQTKGYWNGGYEEWRWFTGVWPNDVGVERKIIVYPISRLLDDYLSVFESVEGLKLFLSCGLFVWLDILLLFVSIIKKDKEGILLSLPVLTIVLSLLVATPVYCEFRYIYVAFCVLPFLVAVVMRSIENNKTTEEMNKSVS